MFTTVGAVTGPRTVFVDDVRASGPGDVLGGFETDAAAASWNGYQGPAGQGPWRVDQWAAEGGRFIEGERQAGGR